MKVVRVNADRSVTLLGACVGPAHAVRPGDYWCFTIYEMPRFDPAADMAPDAVLPLQKACFRVNQILDGEGGRETVIEIRPDSPKVEFLPNWQPARPPRPL